MPLPPPPPTEDTAVMAKLLDTRFNNQDYQKLIAKNLTPKIIDKYNMIHFVQFAEIFIAWVGDPHMDEVRDVPKCHAEQISNLCLFLLFLLSLIPSRFVLIVYLAAAHQWPNLVLISRLFQRPHSLVISPSAGGTNVHRGLTICNRAADPGLGLKDQVLQ